MKKQLFILTLALFWAVGGNAQNIGINTPNPQTAFDINGDLALRIGTITLTGGFNDNVNTTTDKKSIYRLVASGGVATLQPFITGFTGGSNGRQITLINLTMFPIRIGDETATITRSSNENTIFPAIVGALFIELKQNNSVSFIYDSSINKWREIANKPDIPLQTWQSTNNDIFSTNSGNVGIGAYTPLAKLHVEGPSIIANNTAINPDDFPNKVIAGYIAGSNGWASIGIGGKNANQGQSWALGSINGDVSLAASDGVNNNSLQTGLILDRSRNLLLTPFGGNVGIGVNASKAKLEVSTNNTTTALFGSTSTGISLQQNWPTVGFNQYRDNANVQRYIGNGYAMGNFIDPTTGTMAWNANPSGSAGNATPSETTVMQLTKDGKLSIGSSWAPNSTLLVRKVTPGDDGTAVFGGTQHNSHFSYGANEDTYLRGGKDGSAVIINDGNLGNVGVGRFPATKFHVMYGGNAGFSPYGIAAFESNTECFINLMSPAANQSGVLFGSPLGSTRGGIVYTNNNGGAYESLALRTGGNNNALVIDKNGNVAIGNFMPSNKLDVNGTMRAKEVIVETGWADYVFEENYKLKSIDELEAFVKENKHLPNIPAASEIEKNGLKVGETNKAMMEKIEELALYIIQLKKEIDLLKTKN